MNGQPTLLPADDIDSDDEYVPGRDEERTGLGDYIGGIDAGMANSNEHTNKNKGNVIGGYKATLSSKRASPNLLSGTLIFR